MIVDKNVKSLEESAYLALEEEICAGTILPGEFLIETALSAKLGVSRTPLRGAIHRLAEEGLVELIPNRGARVIGVTEKDLIDIYTIRMRLEGLAAAAAAGRIGEEDSAALSEAVELSEFYLQRSNTEKIKEMDTQFHKTIYHASGIRHLNKILSDLHRSIKAYRKLSLTVPTRLELSVCEHRAMMEAIVSHDAEQAERLAVAHVEAALANLLSMTEENNKTEE